MFSGISITELEYSFDEAELNNNIVTDNRVILLYIDLDDDLKSWTKIHYGWTGSYECYNCAFAFNKNPLYDRKTSTGIIISKQNPD